jgi:hypothetical protein
MGEEFLELAPINFTLLSTKSTIIIEILKNCIMTLTTVIRQH